MALGYLLQDGDGGTPTPSTQPIRLSFNCNYNLGASGTVGTGLTFPLTNNGFTTAKLKLSNATIYALVRVSINGTLVGTVSDNNEHSYDISGKDSIALDCQAHPDIAPISGYIELS